MAKYLGADLIGKLEKIQDSMGEEIDKLYNGCNNEEVAIKLENDYNDLIIIIYNLNRYFGTIQTSMRYIPHIKDTLNTINKNLKID